jgi:hypothetical protein
MVVLFTSHVKETELLVYNQQSRRMLTKKSLGQQVASVTADQSFFRHLDAHRIYWPCVSILRYSRMAIQ